MTEKIKIIEYTERWTSGGIESYILNIVRFLDKEKFDVRIVVAQKESDIYDAELQNYGIKVEKILEEIYNNPIKRVLKNKSKFYEFLCKNHCDVLHLHICQGVVMSYAKSAKKAGVKNVITHCHNTELGDGHRFIKLLGHNLGKRLYRKYPDHKIACSDLAAKWLYTKRDIDANKVIICPYIVDIEKYKFSEEDRNSMRKKYSLQNKDVYLHIGRMHYQKNQKFLLKICKEIFAQNGKAMLIFIGTGELEDEIRAYADTLRISDRIIFISKTREIEKFMSMSDVFLLPSLYEGNPVVGTEAQANGLKCYFSNTITKQAKILDSTHFICLKENPTRWAKKIYTDKITPNNKREYACDLMHENGYNTKNQINQIENIYNKQHLN